MAKMDFYVVKLPHKRNHVVKITFFRKLIGISFFSEDSNKYRQVLKK